MASGDGSSGVPPRKQRKLDNGDATDLNDFDKRTRNALREISDCQEELNDLNELAAVEVLQIERRYNKLRKPFFDKRAGFIKKIPNFWYMAFMNNPNLSEIWSHEDLECLKYLNKLEVVDNPNIESGYWINFYFNENPMFQNELLTKIFRLEDTETPSVSTVIEWKSGMQVKYTNDAKAKQSENVKLPRTFFDWFLESTTGLDDEVAYVIKDEIWANPLNIFESDMKSDTDSDVSTDDIGYFEEEDSSEVKEDEVDEQK